MIDKNAKQIVKETQALNELLKEDLDAWDPRTVPGKRTQHNAARERLKVLNVLYTDFVKDAVAGIFLKGSPKAVEAFVSLAVEKGGVIPVDARYTYTKIADSVFDTLGRDRMVYIEHAIQMNRAAMSFGDEVGVPGFPNYTKLMNTPYVERDRLIEDVKRETVLGFGHSLNNGYILNGITKLACEQGLVNSPVPCVIINASEDDTALASVFAGRSVTVTVEGEVTAYTVTKAFNELKKQIKTLTNPSDETNLTNEENTNV